MSKVHCFEKKRNCSYYFMRIEVVYLLHVVEHIPVEYDEEELLRKFGIERMKTKEREVVSLIRESQGLLEPKAVYTYLKVVEIDSDQVRLEIGEKMKSIILRDFLSLGQKVAPYVVTIGSRLDEQVSKLGSENVFLAWVLDIIGVYALGVAKKNLKLIVKEPLGDCISSFDPGSGTGELFGIEQLPVLFQILQPPRKIGVQLTPAGSMIPQETIAGIFVAIEEEYIACQHCPRKCEYRETPYKGEHHPKRSY